MYRRFARLGLAWKRCGLSRIPQRKRLSVVHRITYAAFACISVAGEVLGAAVHNQLYSTGVGEDVESSIKNY